MPVATGEVLHRLDAGGAVDWVGNAWGGHVGLRFAAAQPARCRTLITVGTPLAALSPAGRRVYPLLAVHGLFGPVGPVLAGVTGTLLSERARADDPDAVRLVRDGLQRSDRRMLRNAVVSISLHRKDLTGLLPDITAPTLMITGGEDTVFTPSQADAAVRHLRNARTAVVADAAHLPPLEAPEVTAGLIREFWTAGPPDQPT